MNKINYQLELDRIIENIIKEGSRPSLLMHCCCAPCSSYCLSYLSEYFKITIFYYNPNISPKEEYDKRAEEVERLISQMPLVNKVNFIAGDYEPEKFAKISKGLEDAPEGGERCFKCYELRQRAAADFASKQDFDYFTTTLSISPHKNAQKLNEIGIKLENEYNIKYLVSDFKKKGGYQQSIKLSKEYNLYRQNYCGCVYSRKSDISESTTNNN